RTAETRSRLSKNKVLVASGGIHNTETAIRNLREGADLVEIYTGMIYQGPGFVKSILKKSLQENLSCCFSSTSAPTTSTLLYLPITKSRTHTFFLGRPPNTSCTICLPQTTKNLAFYPLGIKRIEIKNPEIRF